MTPKRIIIDTDPGVDDALAFLLALASPEVQLEALTITHGNVTLETGVRNALAVLELTGAAHIPVVRGASLPLVGPLRASDVAHGASGLGEARLPEPCTQPIPGHAIDFLIERCLAEPGEISIFPIGPLTNIALAIRKEPRFAGAVRELVIMGGAIREGGNVTPQAEFNIHTDPHAAHIVFHSGIPITLVPLDVTHKCILYRTQIETLGGQKSPLIEFLRDATATYINFTKEKTGLDGCALHDPLTLAAVFSPDLLTLEEHSVDVDISGGVSQGKTFADFYHNTSKPANMKVALDVRGEEFVEIFLERIKAISR